MENQELVSLFGLSVDEETAATLRSASKWGRLLAILGFILGVLVILLGTMVYYKMLNAGRSDYASRSMGAIATRYLVSSILFGGIFITGGIFTLNFSSKIATALKTTDQFSLNNGLSAIKSGIVFWAVIFIILIVFILLAFIGIAAL
jgi:hypothetical protein